MASEAQEAEVSYLNQSQLKSQSLIQTTGYSYQMGDATNLVLILAGEMLKKAENLLIMGLHPSEVVLGYEMAVEKARKELESECESLVRTPRGTMS